MTRKSQRRRVADGRHGRGAAKKALCGRRNGTIGQHSNAGAAAKGVPNLAEVRKPLHRSRWAGILCVPGRPKRKSWLKQTLLHSGEEKQYHVRVGVPNRTFWFILAVFPNGPENWEDLEMPDAKTREGKRSRLPKIPKELLRDYEKNPKQVRAIRAVIVDQILREKILPEGPEFYPTEADHIYVTKRNPLFSSFREPVNRSLAALLSKLVFA